MTCYPACVHTAIGKCRECGDIIDVDPADRRWALRQGNPEARGAATPTTVSAAAQPPGEPPFPCHSAHQEGTR